MDWPQFRVIGMALGALAALSPAAWAQNAAKPTFEDKVLPILKERCFKCHAGAEPKNGLKLTSRRDVLTGGKSGPAIRINAAESSLLWIKIAGNDMPQGGPALTAEEKGILRTWINDGAPSSDVDAGDDSPQEAAGKPEDFWSFKPPVKPQLPVVQRAARVNNAVDAFIIAKLEAKGLTLSPEASREVLLRRAYFDLVGLPPPPEVVREFLADNDPLAYERMIDRLLASPHYGERWGRHWLDLAGYADSAGILNEDRPLPTMARYRDYVVAALNKDKPYDRFLQEQIAGDELTSYWTAHETLERLPDEVVEGITATGYLRCAADSSRPDFSGIKNADALYFYPTLQDTLQIVASSTMGLTVQCARCHSHKYDPIPQTEYYRLQAIFMAALKPKQWIPQADRQLAIATAAEQKAATEHNGKLDAEINRLKADLAATREQFKKKFLDQRLTTIPETIRADVQAALQKPADKRNEVEKYLAGKFAALLQPDDAALNKTLVETYPEYKTAVEQNAAAVAAQERQRKHFEFVRALYDVPGPTVTPLLRRGDALTPGPPVEPGVLTALQTPQPFDWTPSPAEAKTTGRRLAFARWLTQPRHPLTSRVMVNRLWLHHFGEGIVATPEDFGTIGASPSHGQLLDYLATEFVASGWSLKQMHRLMMTSSAYRQRSTLDETGHATAMQVDPDNRLLWRQRLRRLEAEPVRDALLAASGLIDESLFGTAVPVARRPDGEVTPADGANGRRRSIYIQILRLNPLSLLHAYDQPVMETNCTRRPRSTVATQALTLLNSDTMVTAAEAMADRVLREASNDPVGRAVLIAYGRPATASELATLTQFVDAQQAKYVELKSASDVARRQALADLCHMLLSANEFVYVD
jgi:hypothetical protein